MINVPAGKRWREMTGWQKTGLVIAAVVQFSLLGAALWDLQRRPEERVRGGKPLWRALVFVNYVGPIAYFVWGRRSQVSVHS